MTRKPTPKTKVPPARHRERHQRHDDDWNVALTLDNIEQTELTASERDVLARASETGRRLGAGSHLDEWLTLTPAVRIIKHLAMKLNHVNRPEGRGYAESFGQMMQRHNLHIFDKTTITALLWLDDDSQRMAILKEIRESMTPGERARLNSPISARQRVEKVLKAREQGTEEKQKDSPVTLLKRKVAELERALAETQAKLARKDDGSLFDLKADSVEDIAAAIAANLHEGKAAALAKALPEAIKGRKRQRQRPAG
jgi:hypothetical protein